MKKFDWESEKNKLECLKFLAQPDVIDLIEAQIHPKEKETYKKEFKGKYDGHFYFLDEDTNKYSSQFRIQLRTTENCPDFLKKVATKDNRINRKAMIADMVQNYGFRFRKGQQDTESILKILNSKENYTTTDKAVHNKYDNILEQISNELKNTNVEPRIKSAKKIEVKNKGQNKSTSNKSKRQAKDSANLSDLQKSHIGWMGEEYLFNLLKSRVKNIYEILNLNADEVNEIRWFNKGYRDEKNFEDKSVGKGCDIELTCNSRQIKIEVKSSLREYPEITFTGNEIISMIENKNNYVLIRITNIIKLLPQEKGKPSLYAETNPFTRLFEPSNIVYATVRL